MRFKDRTPTAPDVGIHRALCSGALLRARPAGHRANARIVVTLEVLTNKPPRVAIPRAQPPPDHQHAHPLGAPERIGRKNVTIVPGAGGTITLRSCLSD